MPETTLMVKARRLRFHILQHSPSVTVADVIGDHDTYRVIAVRGVAGSVACTCPASVEACSHAVAVALWVKEQRTWES